MAIRINYNPNLALAGRIASETGRGGYRQYLDQRQLEDATFKQRERMQERSIQAQQQSEAARIYADRINRLTAIQASQAELAQRIGAQREMAQFDRFRGLEQLRMRGGLEQQRMRGQFELQQSAADASMERERQLADENVQRAMETERWQFSEAQQRELSRLDEQESLAEQMFSTGQLNPDEYQNYLGQINAKRLGVKPLPRQPDSPYPEGQDVGQIWGETIPGPGGAELPLPMTRDKDGIPRIVQGFNPSFFQQQQEDTAAQRQEAERKEIASIATDLIKNAEEGMDAAKARREAEILYYGPKYTRDGEPYTGPITGLDESRRAVGAMLDQMGEPRPASPAQPPPQTQPMSPESLPPDQQQLYQQLSYSPQAQQSLLLLNQAEAMGITDVEQAPPEMRAELAAAGQTVLNALQSRVTSKAEYDALKPGDHYFDPQGRERVKR